MKKILLSLFIGLIGLINFGYCYNLEGLNPSISIWDWEINGDSTISTSASVGDIICLQTKSSSCNSVTIKIGNNTFTGNPYINQTNGQEKGFCVKGDGQSLISVKNNVNSNCKFLTFRINKDTVQNIFPNYTSQECQDLYDLMPISEYTSSKCEIDFGLIPVSSVDENYCVNNGLCSSSECPDIPIGSGDNWSALYINDIQHLGKPIINITFPDYLDWDYTSTGDIFNLDIVGYPVDTEYIDGIIRTQNYKPTSEDFTQLVGMLAPYSKYLLFLLFIFIIWAWIKKPFKSKKL